MKKMISLMVLALILVGLVGTSYAEPYYLEAAGVTIEVPEGMTAEDASDEDAYRLLMAVDGREDLFYGYDLAYVEELESTWLEDLEEDDLATLMELLSMEMESPEFEVVEGEEIVYLAVYESDWTELHYIALLNGWLTDVWAMTDGETELAQEEIDQCESLILSIVYDEQ